jgi:hypothetical protein
VSHERREVLDARMQSALTDLRETIQRKYPSATFEVTRSTDEPENVHLAAIVDVDDTDEVLDLVIDRVVELQVEERIPVHVIPLRTPERILSARRPQAQVRRPRVSRFVLQIK